MVYAFESGLASFIASLLTYYLGPQVFDCFIRGIIPAEHIVSFWNSQSVTTFMTSRSWRENMSSFQMFFYLSANVLFYIKSRDITNSLCCALKTVQTVQCKPHLSHNICFLYYPKQSRFIGSNDSHGDRCTWRDWCFTIPAEPDLVQKLIHNSRDPT